MASRCPLLILPFEIRRMIYQDYFAVSGGYVLSPNLRQLTVANGDRIDLNLIYTCKFIARETRELAFSLNTITISTPHSQSPCFAADLFSSSIVRLYWEEAAQLRHLFLLIDEDIHAEVVRKFPSFRAQMDRLLQLAQCYRPTYLNMDNHLPEYSLQVLTEFQYYREIRHVLHLITARYSTNVLGTLSPQSVPSFIRPSDNPDNPYGLADPEDPEAVAAVEMLADQHRIHVPYGMLRQFICLPNDPWAIPTLSQLRQMIDMHPSAKAQFRSALLDSGFRVKYRFSATAAAIAFLSSLGSAARLQFRNIIINEDHRSVSRPWLHAEGLIPFFEENSHLRIERRINLWNTVFQIVSYDDGRVTGLSAELARWFGTTFALTSAGVPPDSMVTLFDGNPAPGPCSDVFKNIIQQDIALARPVTASFVYAKEVRQAKAASGFDVEDYYENNFEDLVMGLQSLTNGSNMFQCNFDPGRVLEIDDFRANYPARGFKFYLNRFENQWQNRNVSPREVDHPLIKDYEKNEEALFTEEEWENYIEYARENGFF